MSGKLSKAAIVFPHPQIGHPLTGTGHGFFPLGRRQSRGAGARFVIGFVITLSVTAAVGEEVWQDEKRLADLPHLMSKAPL